MFKSVLLFIAVLLVGQRVFVSTAMAGRADDTSYLCESDRNQLSYGQNPFASDKKVISVVTWNAHKFDDPQYFLDLKKISSQTDILFIQEAMHSSGWQLAFNSHMPGFDWSFHKSFCTNNKATGVLTGTRYPQVSPRTIVSTGKEPVSFTPKVSSVSIISIQNVKVLLINTHALNFNLGTDFEDQIDQLVQLISQTQIPVIWAGDFNTWSSGRRSYLFNMAMSVGLDPLIPNNDERFLKLDHILIRGFKAHTIQVLGQFKSSDHVPVLTTLELN